MTKKKLLFLLPFFLFACDESPTAPSDDLVGSWLMISGETPGLVLRIEKSGKLVLTENIEGISFSFPGTWSITAGQLIMTLNRDEIVHKPSYVIRGDQLTLVYAESGNVEVYERHNYPRADWKEISGWREIGICDDYIGEDLEKDKNVEEFVSFLEEQNWSRDEAEQIARDREEVSEKTAQAHEQMEETRALAVAIRAEVKCHAWLIRN